MFDFIEGNQLVLMFFYFIFLLYLNFSYIFEYRQIQDNLKNIETDEVKVKVESIEVLLFTLGFAFFRSWLFYIIVYAMTKNLFIIIILAIFMIMDAYHALYNTTIEQLYKSRIVIFRAILDSFFIISFSVYCIVYMN